MSSSHLESALLLQMMALKLPMPDRECQLIEGRRWRCDFVWLDQ